MKQALRLVRMGLGIVRRIVRIRSGVQLGKKRPQWEGETTLDGVFLC